MTETKIARLRANHRHNPIGIPCDPPFLRWELEGSGTVDSFEVLVGDTPQDLHSRGCWIASGLTDPRVVYDEPMSSRARRYWIVRGRLSDGTESESPTSWFETGLGNQEDWTAQWIAAPLHPYRRESFDPPPLIRKSFQLDAVPDRLRAYVTALGIYRLWVNGFEVTASAVLRPGWTDYSVRVYHQTFDVSRHLLVGENVFAASLARGWYAGRLGLQREPAYYGEQPALRLQVEADRGAIVESDVTWRYSYGAVLSSDLLQGETQDTRLEPQDWRNIGFDDSTWSDVEIVDRNVPIHPQPHDSPAAFETREGRLLWEHARGPAVYDFGQNLVGWTRIETPTLPKADLIVRHGEILTPGNLVYRDNLRTAFQEDRYSTGDSNRHLLEPQFTLHGFRYAEVWGLPSKTPDGPLEVLDNTKVSAVAVDAGMEKVGWFQCSDERVNRLSDAIEWTIRDNFIEVITDCPQRDERLGWLGDAGVISRTSAYYFDVGAFVRKFAQDAADAQETDGTLRSYVPPVPPGTHIDGAPGWADGYVRLVHLLGARYGDLGSVGHHYEGVKRYLARVDADNPSGIRTKGVGSDFGDWLSLPEDPDEPPHPLYGYTGARSTSPRQVVATAHTYRSYLQLAEMAGWLDDQTEEQSCLKRAEEIRRAYVDSFFDSGLIEGDTQTVYAQALGYGLLEGDDAEAAATRLIEKIEDTGHITTGIHGTEHVLPILVRYGRPDLAYRLLLREEMPSWLHMIAMGATTIWEKWDGLTAEGTLSTPEMNSFNHCALGAVGQFLFEGVGGLDLSDAVHHRQITVSPVYDSGLDWVNVTMQSPFGEVSSRWRWEEERVVQEVDLPPLLSGRFSVPAGFTLDGEETTLHPGANVVALIRR